MAVIRARVRSIHFFKSQMGSTSMSHNLFGDLVITSLRSTREAGRNMSSIFPLNIILGHIADFIWGIGNDLIHSYCCFSPEEIAELVLQKFSGSKL